MNANAKRLVEKALAMKGSYFPNEHYGAHPYCASFVRWLYKTALGIKFPIVSDRPYYRKHGINYPPGEWFADSLAGTEVGAEVPFNQMKEGDILFFRDTCEGYVPGTITHVGVCVGPNGLMADAGSDNRIHIRRHQSNFPNLLVEVRRPRVMQTATTTGLELSLKNGQIKASLRGMSVRNLELELEFNGSLRVSVNKKPIHYTVASLNLATTQAVTVVSGGGMMASRTALPGLSSSGIEALHVKLFSHDHKASASIGGGRIGNLKIRILYQGHALHIWINGTETRSSMLHLSVV